MTVEVSTPPAGSLADVLAALGSWQRDDAPIQLHPGDLGWFWRFGADVVAAALRTWSRNGTILAVGFLDGPDVLRMTVAPRCGATTRSPVRWSRTSPIRTAASFPPGRSR